MIASATAVVLLITLAATLYPFNWQPPRTTNGAAPLPGGGIVFHDMGIAYSEAPPPWLATAIETGRLEVALTVRAASARQRGPARILTLSRDIHRRNLTIAHRGTDLDVRLRTPDTDLNGEPAVTVAGVFTRPGWIDIRVTIAPERLVIRIDGEVRLVQDLPADPLRTWDPSYRLALGNEMTGDRAWRGEIRRALVAAGGTPIEYTTPGALVFPDGHWFFHRRFNFVPLTQTTWRDCLQNVVLFSPLAFLLGLAMHRHGRGGAVAALLMVAAISTTAELLQLGFAGRYPALNDILFNLLGGLLGVAMARRLALEPAGSRFR